MTNIYNHLNSLLPDVLKVKSAEGDRIFTENNEVYYNYYSLSLRWLCGYNNLEINKEINNNIEVVQQNPNYIYKLEEEIKTFIINNINSNYNTILFTKENTQSILIDNIANSTKRYFMIIGDVSLSANLNQDQFLSFEKLLELEPDVRSKKVTKEGWNIKQIKNLFKHYSNKLAGLIISPILLEQYNFIDQSTLDILKKLCRKYKLTLVWDESNTCFYRTGEFLFLNNYELSPDFITIDSNIYENKDVHILITTKKTTKKFVKEPQSLEATANAINILIIHSIISFLVKNNIKNHIERISFRLSRKLNALSSNINNRFTFKSRGLIFLIKLENETYFERLSNFFVDRKLLIEAVDYVFLLIPQLTLSERAVDLLIQTIDDFFKSGLKLKTLKN